MPRSGRNWYPDDRGYADTRRDVLVSVRIQARQADLLEQIAERFEFGRSQAIRGAIEAWAAELGIKPKPLRADPRQGDWVGPKRGA